MKMSIDFCRCKSATACGNSSRCKCRRTLGRACIKGLCQCGDGCTNIHEIAVRNSLIGSKLDEEVKHSDFVELKNDNNLSCETNDANVLSQYSDNYWCECPLKVLVNVSEWTLDWPKCVPSGLTSFGKQLVVDVHKWSDWTSRRAQLTNNSMSKATDTCQRVYVITKFASKRVIGEQLALVWFSLPLQEQIDNKQQQQQQEGHLNLVSIKTLQRLRYPIWDGCKFPCGGIHEEKYPCPAKVQSIKQAIQEMMMSQMNEQQQQSFQTPEFPCPFGNCGELFHKSATSRCKSLVESQQPVVDLVTRQIQFERDESQRPCLKIFSWNTQKTLLSAKGMFTRKGFSSVEKQSGIGWPNIRRAYLPEEAKLYETLVDNLKEEIDRIKPDLFMFQEFGPMEDRFIERFLSRLGLLNNKEFKWKVISFPRDDGFIQSDNDVVETMNADVQQLQSNVEGLVLKEKEEVEDSLLFSTTTMTTTTVDNGGDCNSTNSATPTTTVRDDNRQFNSTTTTTSESNDKKGDDENKKKLPEQHLFVWRTSTITNSIRPKDYLKFAKHGSPTGGFVHLQTGKLIVLTSLHLQCGGTSAPRETGAYYQSALKEYSTLLETYWSIPKPVRYVNEEWTCAYERAKAASGDHLHFLGGDLNLNPHLLKDQQARELMNKSGFMSTGSRYTVTNAGVEERGYDFFLVDERVQRMADVHQRVLRSSSTKRNGNVGLSDHDPVLLQLDFFEKVDAKGRTFQFA